MQRDCKGRMNTSYVPLPRGPHLGPTTAYSSGTKSFLDKQEVAVLVLSEPKIPNPDEKASDDARLMPAVISRAGAGTCDYNLLQQLAMDAVQKGQDYDMHSKSELSHQPAERSEESGVSKVMLQLVRVRKIASIGVSKPAPPAQIDMATLLKQQQREKARNRDLSKLLQLETSPHSVKHGGEIRCSGHVALVLKRDSEEPFTDSEGPFTDSNDLCTTSEEQ